MGTSFDAFRQKMGAAGQSGAAINSFARNFERLESSASALIPECDIEPVQDLPSLDEVVGGDAERGGALLNETVLIKLNGGLGTGMGLRKAKSLLTVRDGLTFLDLIAKQVLSLRGRHRAQLPFLLMNSYATSGETLEYLERYAELGGKRELELMQSRVPKIDAASMAPAVWSEDPELEWCPPGHGDLYPSLLGTGWLDLLLARGVRYAFVSNSDNLGATLDLDLLGYFSQRNSSFLMEVTSRTEADRKGGHLAMRSSDGALLLRESAQCPEEDMESFQDVQRHRYFNTNNLWVRLDRLKEALDANGSILPLPVIQNRKHVNPRDQGSAAVYQLETAMGAAIECFENAAAIEVGRERFAPVKTTDDLLLLRSDAYEITEDFRPQLRADRGGVSPIVRLDENYKLVDQLEASTSLAAPSLRECSTLTVRGPIRFGKGVVIAGEVTLENTSDEVVELPGGRIENTTVKL